MNTTTTTKIDAVTKAQMAAEKAAARAAKAGEKAAAVLEKAIARDLARAEKAKAAEAAKAEREAAKAAKKAEKAAEKELLAAAALAEKAAAKAAKKAEKAAEKELLAAAALAEKAAKEELRLIGDAVFMVKEGNVYAYDELTGEVGDYVGRLTKSGKIISDAAEETAATKKVDAARQARTAAKKAERMAAKMAAAKVETDARDALRLEYYQTAAHLDALETAMVKMQEEMALLRRRQGKLWDEITAISA